MTEPRLIPPLLEAQLFACWEDVKVSSFTEFKGNFSDVYTLYILLKVSVCMNVL